ncbi:hypothetical protein MD484_g8575, partial [Candolleomyces efflorescens]
MAFYDGLSSSVSAILGGVAIVVVLRGLARRWGTSSPSSLPYPPGPKGLPIIGNLLDLPLDRPYEGYAKLSKQYGDIMFFSALGQQIVVLSSVKRITDLLEKQSGIFSGRPHSVMMHELLEFDNFFAVTDYGPYWRKHRRAFHQHFYAGAIPQYLPIVKTYTQRYLVALSAPNATFDEVAREAIAGLGIEIIYGVEFSKIDEAFIRDVLSLGKAFKLAAVPGRFWVENLPFLKYIPSWMPGAMFRRWAIEYREVSRRILNDPFRDALQSYGKGEVNICMATSLIDRLPTDDEVSRDEGITIARNVCAQTHLAAVDTTHGAAMAFYLAMVVYPHVQKIAQDELDRVVGHGVLPDVKHKPELPYLGALLKELLRWIQVVPLALPHLATEDHVYDGYFIPKGTVVFGNAWGLMHDPDVFEDPMTFNPERFLREGQPNPDILDPMFATFGFGRRSVNQILLFCLPDMRRH